MRRILLAFAMILVTSVYCSAQTNTQTQGANPSKAEKKAGKIKRHAATDAQSATTAASSPATGLKKDGTPDRRLKVNRTTTAPPAAAATAPVTASPAAPPSGLKKDGTPDMRLKANRAKVVQPSAAPAPQTLPPAPAQTPAIKSAASVAPSAKVRNSTGTPDAVVATDAKGRTIYQGKRGGKYYINKNGNKEYIKQTP